MLTTASLTDLLTLDEVTSRIAQREVVDAILIMGSAGKDALAPASDYDLLVVLSGMPVPLHLVLTTIDRRLAELYFTSVATLDRILSATDMDALGHDPTFLRGAMLAWIKTGRIVFDRSGRLRDAQNRLRAAEWSPAASDRQIYSHWFNINYNLQQNKLMLASGDPVRLTALDLRLLFCLHDVWVRYFLVRRLPWQGDKEAVRYLDAHDPEYLDLFRQCLAETDRGRKVRLYEHLARLSLAPVGGLWEDGVTAVELQPETELRPGTVETALAFWESLVSGELQRTGEKLSADGS